MLCAALVTAAHMIFMTGQYLVGAKPFTLAPSRSARSSRSATLGRFKMLCAALVTAARMIFMTGQYLVGAKLFTAPVDLAPVPDAVCRSGA